MGQTNSKFTTKNEYDELNRLIDEEFHMDDLTASYSFRYYRRGMGGNKTSHLIYMLSFKANNQARVTQYYYCDNGNLASITDHSDYGGARTYQYDGTNQMITERIDDNSITYTYDAGANITSKTEKGITTTWLYEDEQWSDLLTSYDGQTITYDEIGNPLTYRDGMSFAWEKGRQLKQVTKEDEITSYQYNSSGLRTQKVSSKYGTTTYMLEGGLILSSTSENETIYFYYNEKNQAVAMRINDETYVYERNLQGDIVGLLDKTGTWVAKYSYNAWREPIYTTDNKGHDISGDRTHVANKNPYRYRGYYYDVETGFYYLKTRYYDPITCRFINADSYLQTAQGFYDKNVFAYCENDPVNRVDTEGDFWWFTAAVGAVIGAVASGVKQVVSNVMSGDNWYDGLAGAMVGGAVEGGIIGGTGNVAVAGAVTNEAISYVSGEKELTWDNIQQSNITVLQNATTDLVVGKVADRALPALKTSPSAKPLNKKVEVATAAGRDMVVEGTSNIIINSFSNGATPQQKQQAVNMAKDAWNITKNAMNYVFNLMFHFRPF